MKKVLVLAAIGEAATGPGAVGCSVACWPVVARRGTDRSCHPGSARARHRLDRIGYCLLALRVCIPRTLRDVDLQRAYHGVSLVSRHSRRMGRASPVAGSRVACSSDAASRAGLVQATREQTNMTIRRSSSGLPLSWCIALKPYSQIIAEAARLSLTPLS